MQRVETTLANGTIELGDVPTYVFFVCFGGRSYNAKFIVIFSKKHCHQ